MDGMHFLADAALADAKPPLPTPTPSSSSSNQRITLPPLASIMPSPPPTANASQISQLNAMPSSSRSQQPPLTSWPPGRTDGAASYRLRPGPSRSSSTRSKRDYPFGDGEHHSSTQSTSGSSYNRHTSRQSRSREQMPFPQQPSADSRGPSPANKAAEPHPLHRLRLDKTYPERSVLGWHEEAQRLLAPPGSSLAIPHRAQSFSHPPFSARSNNRCSPSTPYVIPRQDHPPPHYWALSQGPSPFMPQHSFPRRSQRSLDFDQRQQPSPHTAHSNHPQYALISPSVPASQPTKRIGVSISDDSIAGHRGRGLNRDVAMDGRRSASAHMGSNWGQKEERAPSAVMQDMRQPVLPAQPDIGGSSRIVEADVARGEVSPLSLPPREDSDVVMAEGDGESQEMARLARNSSASNSESSSPSSSSHGSCEPKTSQGGNGNGRGPTIRLRIPQCPPSSINSGLSGPQSSTTRTHSASISSTASSFCVKAEPDYDWSPNTSRQSKNKRSTDGRKRSRTSTRRGAGAAEAAARMATSEEEEEDEDELLQEGLDGDGDGVVEEEMQGKNRGGRKNGPKRRMQNAVAQKRFRQKKKQMTVKMAADLQVAEEKNDVLKRQLAEKDALVEKLQGQVGQLKRKLSSRTTVTTGRA